MLEVNRNDQEVTIYKDGWICVENKENDRASIIEWNDLKPADRETASLLIKQIEKLEVSLLNLVLPNGTEVGDKGAPEF